MRLIVGEVIYGKIHRRLSWPDHGENHRLVRSVELVIRRDVNAATATAVRRFLVQEVADVELMVIMRPRSYF